MAFCESHSDTFLYSLWNLFVGSLDAPTEHVNPRESEPFAALMRPGTALFLSFLLYLQHGSGEATVTPKPTDA